MSGRFPVSAQFAHTGCTIDFLWLVPGPPAWGANAPGLLNHFCGRATRSGFRWPSLSARGLRRSWDTGNTGVDLGLTCSQQWLPNNWSIRRQRGAANLHWSQPKVILRCKICGSITSVDETIIAKRNHSYVSKSCKRKSSVDKYHYNWGHGSAHAETMLVWAESYSADETELTITLLVLSHTWEALPLLG